MRRAVLLLSLLGTILFAGAFALSIANPLAIERAAREIVRIEVERRVGERIEVLTEARLAGIAERVLQQTDADIEATRRAIREELPRKVANVAADMLNANCECRGRMVESAQRWEAARLSSQVQLRERLVVLIESAYANVAQSLMREFRIFTSSNAVAFALLGVVTLVRRRAGLQLALPAIVLVGSVALTGGLYLFNQNWLHTMVFGEYVGLAYAVHLALVALLLCDLLFNRARVTTRLVNLVLDAVGSAVSAAPC